MLVSTSILGGHVDTISAPSTAGRRRRRLHSDEQGARCDPVIHESGDKPCEPVGTAQEPGNPRPWHFCHLRPRLCLSRSGLVARITCPTTTAAIPKAMPAAATKKPTRATARESKTVPAHHVQNPAGDRYQQPCKGPAKEAESVTRVHD